MIRSENTQAPIQKIHVCDKQPNRRPARRSMMGFCLKCGHKVTYFGKPFTAEIPCSKGLFINIFIDSQQPIGGRW
jgi:hypothetical protein